MADQEPTGQRRYHSVNSVGSNDIGGQNAYPNEMSVKNRFGTQAIEETNEEYFSGDGTQRNPYYTNNYPITNPKSDSSMGSAPEHNPYLQAPQDHHQYYTSSVESSARAMTE